MRIDSYARLREYLLRARKHLRHQIKRVIIKYGTLNSPVYPHNSMENTFLPQSEDPIRAVKYNLVPRLLLLTLPSPPPGNIRSSRFPRVGFVGAEQGVNLVHYSAVHYI